MRCKACNVLLEDYETTRKDKDGNYFDMCSVCITASYDGDVESTEDLGNSTQDILLIEDLDTYYNIK